MNINTNDFKKLLSESVSYSDVARKLNLHVNGKCFKEIKKLIQQHNLDCDHFLTSAQISNIRRYGHPDGKYLKINKNCPVCKKIFETQKGHKNEKTVCSHACANTYFRSGQNNPNYEVKINFREYAKIQKQEIPLRKKKTRYHFEVSDLKCTRCGYNEFSCGIDIHHIDGDNSNDVKENLIPLCPSCHRALHCGLWKLEDLPKEIFNGI